MDRVLDYTRIRSKRGHLPIPNGLSTRLGATECAQVLMLTTIATVLIATLEEVVKNYNIVVDYLLKVQL